MDETSVGHLVQPPAQSGPLRVGCPGPCPDHFCIDCRASLGNLCQCSVTLTVKICFLLFVLHFWLNFMRFLSAYCSGNLCRSIDFFRKGDKITKIILKCYSIFHKNYTRFYITVPEGNSENFLLLPCRLESSLIKLIFLSPLSLRNIRKLYLRVLEVHTNGMRTSCVISGSIMSIYLCVWYSTLNWTSEIIICSMTNWNSPFNLMFEGLNF